MTFRLVASVALLTSSLWAGIAYAKTCFYAPEAYEDAGENLYPLTWCNPRLGGFLSEGYGMLKTEWDEGFGATVPCDTLFPTARAFNAEFMLQYASPNPAAFSKSYEGNVLRWAGNWAINHIDHLDGECGSGNAFAGDAAFTSGDDVDVYWPFFYGMPIVMRASVLFHESLHTVGVEHDSNGTCNAAFGGQARLCDHAFGSGANTYQAAWLWWFYVEGNVWTDDVRDQAKMYGDNILVNYFDGGPATAVVDGELTILEVCCPPGYGTCAPDC